MFQFGSWSYQISLFEIVKCFSLGREVFPKCQGQSTKNVSPGRESFRNSPREGVTNLGLFPEGIWYYFSVWVVKMSEILLPELTIYFQSGISWVMTKRLSSSTIVFQKDWKPPAPSFVTPVSSCGKWWVLEGKIVNFRNFFRFSREIFFQFCVFCNQKCVISLGKVSDFSPTEYSIPVATFPREIFNILFQCCDFLQLEDGKFSSGRFCFFPTRNVRMSKFSKKRFCFWFVEPRTFIHSEFPRESFHIFTLRMFRLKMLSMIQLLLLCYFMNEW